MRRVAILASLLLPWYAVAVAAGDILLRTAAIPQEAWVGQRVVLQIDVLGEDGWAQISRFGEMDLPGAYMIRSDSQGVRLQESIDGVAYTGQRYEVSIYPQLAGAIEVPAIPVEVTTRTWGTDATHKVQQGQTPAFTILAKIPPGAEGMVGLVSTTRFKAEQQWEPALDGPRVGDALTRTLTMQAEDVSAMAFTPLQFDDLAGVGIYSNEPTLKDSTDRGSLTGKRIETVTYVFERAGAVAIPDVVLTWWDVSAQKLETVTLPGRELSVAAAAAGESGAATAAFNEQFDLHRLWLPGTLVFILGLLLLRARKMLAQRWGVWRRCWNESETRYFRLAARSIRSKDAHLALRDIMRWLDRVSETDRPAQLRDFLDRYGDANALAVLDQLMHSVAADARLSDPAALLKVLQGAREQWRVSGRSKSSTSYILPELNRGCASQDHHQGTREG